jgi:transcriptional regulator with XRE-family HTH domain
MKVNGEAVKAIRKAQRLTIRDLAARAGLDVGYLSKIENKVKGASDETIERIAAGLEVTIGAISHPDPPQALAREDAIEQIVGMLRAPVVSGS